MQSDVLPVAQPKAESTPAEQESVLPPLWRDGFLWLALLLSVFVVAPFALPGYFWGANDARHHVYFLHQFNRVVEDGVWWPRWSPDFAFGYGYPFFNIYGPFSHFIGVLLLRFGGLDYTGAVEAVFGLSIVASAAAMYLCARDWAGRAAGLVAALVYTFLPYHLLNLYVRANLAESMAFVWLPLCLWTLRRSVIRPTVGWVIGLAVAYAGLMLTSNLVIVLFTPFLVAYAVVLAVLYAKAGKGRLRRVFWGGLWPALGLAAGLSLSAVFWIPAVLEQKYVRVDQWFDGRYDYRGNFVYVQQLFSTAWGFGISRAGPDDPISFQIGPAALLLALVGGVIAWMRGRPRRGEVAFFATAALVAVVVTLQPFAWLWELPVLGTVLGYAQFPWRWFSVMAPFISLLAGPAVAGDWEARPGRRLDLATLAVAAAVVLASYPYLRVQISEPAEGPVSLAALMRFQQSSDEMTGSTAWVKEIPTWSPMADYYVSQEKAGGPVIPVTTLLDYTVFDYETFGAGTVAHTTVSEEVYYENRRDTDQTLIFNQFYYPGWRVWLLDGEQGERVRELPIVPEESGTLGRMTVAVPPGEGFLLLEYGDTLPRAAGRWLSLGAALALLLAAAGAALGGRRRKGRTPITPPVEGSHDAS